MNVLIFAFLTCALYCSSVAFNVLPYVQIDLAFYFRLAQCQAKCTEKYGTADRRKLLDGSERRFFNTSSIEHQWCERGCFHGRLFSKKTLRSTTSSQAFKEGQLFWSESAIVNGTQGKSPIENVDILCVNPVMTDAESGLVDSLNARLVARVKADFIAPVKFVVQWKQMSMSGGIIDETKWITAAVEDSPLVVAQQLQPGIFYQFLITAVGPVGRLGASVASDWLQAPSLATSLPSNAGLSIKSQFTIKDGVGAILKWPQIESVPLSVPTALSAYKMAPSQASCQFQVLLYNSTSTWTNVVDKDEGTGYLFQNLAFASDYSISLRSYVPGNNDTLSENNPWPLKIEYRTVNCAEIHGKGSLECEPEPVSNLTVMLNIKNASAKVSWTPAVDHAQILTYQLIYAPLLTSDDACKYDQTSIFLSATTTSTTILLPSTRTSCNYEVKIITYDLIGRDAVTTTNFRFTSDIHVAFPDVFAQLWIAIIPIGIILIFCLLIQSIKCCHKRSKNTSNIKSKIPPQSV